MENQSAPNTAPVESAEADSSEEESTGSESQAQQGTNPGVTAQEQQKKEEKRFLRKLKIQVDKEEQEEELPFDLPDDPKVVEYMKQKLQLSKMSSKRAQYANTLEKEFSQFFEDLQNNTENVLGDPRLGIDFDKVVARYIEKKAQEAKKTPEQKKHEALESELKKEREEKEKIRKDFEKKEFERLTQQQYDSYQNSIQKALDTSDLPKNSPYVVRKMTDYLLTALDANIDLSPAEIVPLVREEIFRDIKEMFGAAPDEVVESLLGKERLTNYRKKNLNKAKEAMAPLSQIKDVASKKDEKPKKKLNYSEFFGI